jgi:hypothetical protein
MEEVAAAAAADALKKQPAIGCARSWTTPKKSRARGCRQFDGDDDVSKR